MTAKSLGSGTAGVLDAVAAVVLMVAAVALVGIALAARGGKMPPKQVDYAEGEILPPLGSFVTGSPALLTYLQPTCAACTASVPFWRRVLQAPERIRVVAATYADPQAIRAYLAEHELDVDDVLFLPRDGSLRLTFSPTLLLLDADMTIQAVWRGRLQPEREDEVLQRIAPGGS